MICLMCGNDMCKISNVTYECLDCKGSYELEFNDKTGNNEWVFYEYDGESSDDYVYDNMLDDTPIGCLACGGEYPLCKDSCLIFD